jgi:transcriptional regulator with XRE-family HTH domain
VNRWYRLRVEHGMTQQEVADKAGLSRQTVARLEYKADVEPNAPTIKKLADCYGLKVEELIPEKAA